MLVAETGVAGNGKTLWGGAGLSTTEDLTVDNVLDKAGINWDVAKEQLYRPNGEICKGANALVRITDGQVLAPHVGDDYTPLQNSVLRDFAGAIARVKSDVRFATAMSLRKGQIVTLLAHMNTFELLGDRVYSYLSVCNYHGGGSLKAYPTNLFESCFNSHSYSIGNAEKEKRVWTRRHTKNAIDVMSPQNLEDARKVLRMGEQQQQQLTELAHTLVAQKVTPAAFNTMMEGLFDYKKPDFNDLYGEELKKARRELDSFAEKRELLWKYHNTPDNANFTGTAWGILRAVTAFQTHVTSASKTTKPEVLEARRENRLIETMETASLERSAIGLLMALA